MFVPSMPLLQGFGTSLGSRAVAKPLTRAGPRTATRAIFSQATPSTSSSSRPVATRRYSSSICSSSSNSVPTVSASASPDLSPSQLPLSPTSSTGTPTTTFSLPSSSPLNLLPLLSPPTTSLFRTSLPLQNWHYRHWQRQTAGWLRTFMRNKLPNNEMIGYVINDKHPKSIRVACDRFLYVMRYKKSFRYTKKVWCHDEREDCRLGDVVRVQPLGYRLGPWKTYTLVKTLHREPRDEGSLRGSDARNLNHVPEEEEDQRIVKVGS